MKNYVRILPILVLMFTASLSPAQEMDSLYVLSLEDLMNITITTASKQEESVGDAAAVISVITSKEIQSYGALSLVDVLDRATNTYFTSGYTYRDNMLSIRGNATADVNTNVLILLDGRPIRESLTNGLSSPVYASFPLDRIDRLEIIRGPGSILYGTCALTGVVNIITKTADRSAPFTASFRYGTFNTLQGNLTGAKTIGPLALTAGVTLLNTDGWEYKTIGAPFYMVDPSSGEQTLLNPDPGSVDMYKKNIGVNLGARVGGFKVSANFLKSKQANLGIEPFWFNFVPGAPPQKDFYTDISRYMVDLGYEKKISNQWTAAVNLTNNLMVMDKRYPDFRNFRDKADSRDHLFEVTNYFVPTENMNLIVGGLLNYQTGSYDTYQVKDGVNVAFSPEENTASFNMVRYDQLWWSAYAQGQYKLAKSFKLIAGMQANKVTDLDVDVVPRVGGIISFSKNLGAKILYGKAFRSPSQYERNARNFPQVTNNPDLKPEKIGTFETQLCYTAKKFEVYATYYQSIQENVIRLGAEILEYSPGIFIPVAKYVNAGELKSAGVELEGKAFLTSSLGLNFSASYQQTNDVEEDDQDIFGMPQFMGKVGLNYSTPFGMTISVFNAYFGKGENIATDETEELNPPAKAYNFMSTNVQYDVSSLFNTKNPLVIGVFVNNVLDEEVYYQEYIDRKINTFPGRGGRAFYGNITYRF
jgi:outer membrane receptor for ferrienterochelin and colicins